MGFLLYTFIGIAVAFVHMWLPVEHRVGPASGFALGVFGAWGGALFASAFHQGGWAIFPPVAFFGAALGAAGAIAFFEFAAEVHVHREERSL